MKRREREREQKCCKVLPDLGHKNSSTTLHALSLSLYLPLLAECECLWEPHVKGGTTSVSLDP